MQEPPHTRTSNPEHSGTTSMYLSPSCRCTCRAAQVKYQSQLEPFEPVSCHLHISYIYGLVIYVMSSQPRRLCSFAEHICLVSLMCAFSLDLALLMSRQLICRSCGQMNGEAINWSQVFQKQ